MPSTREQKPASKKYYGYFSGLTSRRRLNRPKRYFLGAFALPASSK